MSAQDLRGWVYFLLSFGLPFLLYVLAQLVALVRLRGRARLWSALAIPFMAWVMWGTVDAFRRQLNLWPLGLILLSPVALLYLGLVASVARARARGERAFWEQEL